MSLTSCLCKNRSSTSTQARHTVFYVMNPPAVMVTMTQKHVTQTLPCSCWIFTQRHTYTTNEYADCMA